MGTWASVYSERAGKDGINFQEKPPPPYVLSKTSATMPTFVGISAIGGASPYVSSKASATMPKFPFLGLDVCGNFRS